MERISRESGVPVNPLWEAHKKPDIQMRTWGPDLLAYYEKVFPNPKFDPFIELHDRQLQDAFQKAVVEDVEKRDRTEIEGLFEKNWNFLKFWIYEQDRAGAHYLRGKYALMAGWLNMGSALGLSQDACLEIAADETDLCLSSLDAQHFSSDREGLKMRALKQKLSTLQRLHLAKFGEPLPLTKALETSELKGLLNYLLSSIEGWTIGHFNRWQLARDAVTVSSALNLLSECSRAYAILLAERSEFEDSDFSEWSQNAAHDDPDLVFFQANIHEIRKLVSERK
jgi:hypothetical protein